MDFPFLSPHLVSFWSGKDRLQAEGTRVHYKLSVEAMIILCPRCLVLSALVFLLESWA